MGDARREMERLRPVYETGVLRLLLRRNSRMYVALLRAAFDPLTGDLPRETLEERFAQGLAALADIGEYTPEPDRTLGEAAHHVLVDLTREGEGDYAWLANSHDAASHRFLYRLTARAHRAIEALGRLEDESRTLSGAQANSIIMEVEHARMRLTADPGERVRLLNREIKERKHEIKRIQQGLRNEGLDASQVEDIIAVIHNTLRGVPIDLRELVLAERDNGDALRRRMQAGDMGVDEILGAYDSGYRANFGESDMGRRFEDAFQVIITDEGRQQIDEAMRAIARTPYLADESAALLRQVRGELANIYAGIEAVRAQMRVSNEEIGRLVRQQTDTRYRSMLTRLNRLYAAINADAKAHQGGDGRPYDTDTAGVRLAPLPTRPARPMTRSASPSLDTGTTDTDGSRIDLKTLIDNGGPRLRRMIALIRRKPVMDGDRIDIAASFNRLPERDRRESELVGFLGAIGGQGSGDAVWHCVTIDGNPRDWRTCRLTAAAEELDAIMEEG